MSKSASKRFYRRVERERPSCAEMHVRRHCAGESENRSIANESSSTDYSRPRVTRDLLTQMVDTNNSVGDDEDEEEETSGARRDTLRRALHKILSATTFIRGIGGEGKEEEEKEKEKEEGGHDSVNEHTRLQRTLF